MFEQLIAQFAKNRNLIAGITDAARLGYLEDADLSASFVRFGKEERIDPRVTMPGAKSVVVIGAGYKKKESFVRDGEPRGVFSSGAAGLDYHKKMLGLLADLKKTMESVRPFESMAFCDTGPLIEREFAKKAGIARQGKSGNLISEKFGTYFNIGCLLTDLALKPAGVSFEKEPAGAVCGACDACMTACPAQAITESGWHPSACVSCLTQKKGPLTDQEMQAVGDRLYGCDVCQTVCRLNKGVPAETISDINAVRPKIADILNLTNQEFNIKYKDTAIGWRGLAVLKRNAVIAGANIGAGAVLDAAGLSAYENHPVVGCAVAYYRNKAGKIQ